MRIQKKPGVYIFFFNCYPLKRKIKQNQNQNQNQNKRITF